MGIELGGLIVVVLAVVVIVMIDQIGEAPTDRKDENVSTPDNLGNDAELKKRRSFWREKILSDIFMFGAKTTTKGAMVGPLANLMNELFLEVGSNPSINDKCDKPSLRELYTSTNESFNSLSDKDDIYAGVTQVNDPSALDEIKLVIEETVKKLEEKYKINIITTTEIIQINNEGKHYVLIVVSNYGEIRDIIERYESLNNNKVGQSKSLTENSQENKTNN